MHPGGRLAPYLSAGMGAIQGHQHADDTNERFLWRTVRRRLDAGASPNGADAQFQESLHRTTGGGNDVERMKDLNVKGAQELYEHPANQLNAGMQIQHIDELTQSIEKMRKWCWPLRGSCRTIPS